MNSVLTSKAGYKASVYHNSCYAMGTRLNVVITEPILSGDSVFDQIVQEVTRLENKLSRFSKNSDVFSINQNARFRPVKIDHEMKNILLTCKDYYTRTNGAFDITLLSKSQAPKHLTGLQYSVQDDNVAFSSPHVQIDLGGFGKGYAIKKVDSILRNNGVQNALVSFGESSILAIGHHPFGDCWKIRIANIKQPDCDYIFELKDQSISTSGFRKNADNEVDFHIISPANQQPVKSLSLITVQSSDPLEAEILSTALFASVNTDITFRENFKDCRIVKIDQTDNKSTEM